MSLDQFHARREVVQSEVPKLIGKLAFRKDLQLQICNAAYLGIQISGFYLYHRSRVEHVERVQSISLFNSQFDRFFRWIKDSVQLEHVHVYDFVAKKI